MLRLARATALGASLPGDLGLVGGSGGINAPRPVFVAAVAFFFDGVEEVAFLVRVVALPDLLTLLVAVVLDLLVLVTAVAPLVGADVVLGSRLATGLAMVAPPLAGGGLRLSSLALVLAGDGLSSRFFLFFFSSSASPSAGLMASG